MKVKVKSLDRVQLFVTQWTVAYQAPPSMGFSRQEYWSGLPFPSPGDLPNPGIEPWPTHIGGRRFNLWATGEAQVTTNLVAYNNSFIIWLVCRLESGHSVPGFSAQSLTELISSCQLGLWFSSGAWSALPGSLAVGRIQFLGVVGLRAPFFLFVVGWDRSKLLETVASSLPCGCHRQFTWMCALF